MGQSRQFPKKKSSCQRCASRLLNLPGFDVFLVFCVVPIVVVLVIFPVLVIFVWVVEVVL